MYRLIGLGLTLMACSVWAQPFVRKIGVAEGIAGTVFVTHQDRYGFMWLGTNDGLVRYDGYEFKKYRSSEDPNHIVNNHINSIREDGDGNLLIASQEGVSKLVLSTDSIVCFKKSAATDFADFREGINNTLWLSSSGGFFKISTGRFGREKPKQIHASDSAFQKIFLDAEGMPFTYNTTSIYGLNPRGDSLLEYGLPNSPIAIRAEQFDEKTLLVSTNTNQFYWFSLATRQFTACQFKYPPQKESTLRPFSIFITSKKSIWLNAINKTYIYKNIDASPDVYTYKGATGWGNNIYSVTQDKHGLLWIGTGEQGVVVFNPSSRFFKSTPLHASAWKLCRTSENEYWVATSNGLSHIQGGIAEPVNDGLLSDALYSIAQLPDGTLAVGSPSHGLLFVSPESGKVVRHLKTDAKGTLIKTPLDLQIDDFDRLWIATRMGLFFSDKPYAKVHLFSSVESTSINDLHLYENNLWVAGNGIYLIKLPNLETHHFLSDGYNGFMTVTTADNRHVWTSSINYGFALLNPDTKKIKWMKERDGLPNNNVTNVFESKGLVWLTTNAGLVRFQPADSVYTVFDKTLGLPTHEFALNGYHLIDDHEIVCNDQFIVRLDLDSLTTPSTKPKAIISSLNLFYDPIKPSPNNILTKPAFMTESITLRHDQNVLSFTFSCDDQLNPQANQYEFKLEGFNNAWNKADSRNRTVTFTNLAPGQYTFMVRAISPVGQVGEPTALKVLVTAPFWYSIWFVVSSILLFTAVVVFIARFVSYRKMKQHLRELKVREDHHQEIDRISKELHDNVGSNLSLIISNLDYLQFKNKISEAEKVSDVARNTLQQLRETIWATHQANFSLSDFKNKLLQFVSQIPQTEKPVEIFLDIDSIAIELKPGQVLNLFRIAQEAIINSVKHSRTDKIVVNMKYIEGALQLSIQDWGIGFDSKNEPDGHYGLINMKKRANTLKANLSVTSSPNGTILVLSMPLE